MFSKQGFIAVCLIILAALLITGCVPTTPAITPEPTRTPTPIPEYDETYPDLQEWLFGDAQNVTLTAKWEEIDCKTWGPEKKPLLWNCQHTGIDYAALAGTAVYSATKGKVIRVEHGKDCNGLKCLSTVAIYNKTTDVTFIYLHTKDIKVKENDEVKAGDPIAAVGSRGPGGIHLHFEARDGEQPYASPDDVRKTINPYEAAKEARTAIGPVHNLTKDTYYNTIQSALDDADSGNTIEVADGTYDESITFPSGKKIILQSVNGASSTIIRGNDDSNTVHLNNSSEGTTLNGFTITHADGLAGRGIYNRSYLSINNCIISGNSGILNGSGIYNDGTLTITGSTVSGNSANYGGGIYSGSLSWATNTIGGSSSTDIDNFNTFIDNYKIGHTPSPD